MTSPNRIQIAATTRIVTIIHYRNSAGRGASHRLVDTSTGVNGRPRRPWRRWGRRRFVWRVAVLLRRVAVRGEKEFAAAVCAHAVRGGGGGGGGGGLHRYSHRAAQLEEKQNKREHREAECECGRHSYLREVLGRERGSSVLPRSCWTTSASFVPRSLSAARSLFGPIKFSVFLA